MSNEQANAPAPTLSTPTPTLGRVVLFHADANAQPEAALIVDVFEAPAGDVNQYVTLTVFGHNGATRAEERVRVNAQPDGRNDVEGKQYRWPAFVPAGAVGSKAK